MPSNSKIVEDVLNLLQHYGWETGYKKLEAELQATDDERGRAARELFLGWMAAERGSDDEAIRHFAAVGQMPSLAGWALVGQSFVAMRRKDFRRAHQLLDEASRGDSADATRQATIAHLRGSVLYHEGKAEEARPLLLEALRAFGREHFGTGRVLDTLEMIYAGKDNFHAARECFEQAIASKQRFNDDAGMALSHGQLGRLYLDWGLWAKAEQHFQQDLAIAQRIEDEHGQAQMYNFLGQVALARNAWQDAAGWIEASIRRAEEHEWTVL